MKPRFALALPYHVLSLLSLLALMTASATARTMKENIPYLDDGHPRHVLDVFAPEGAAGLPVVFWIHGGGWQVGDKDDVQVKPRYFNERGYVFVSTNYRLLPEVDMGTLVRDVASALGWVVRHIGEHGGDPSRLFVMGHSAGAQLAALLSTDHRYLDEVGVDPRSLKGCVPVDGDTYDIPAIIETAETRRRAHGQPLPTNGHRQKFGNDPEKHVDFSAVTHVAGGKPIPPFLILHVADHPDVSAQAQRFAQVLKAAGVPTTVFGARGTNHVRLNEELGTAGDAATAALEAFLEGLGADRQ
jgi:arylformamidase